MDSKVLEAEVKWALENRKHRLFPPGFAFLIAVSCAAFGILLADWLRSAG